MPYSIRLPDGTLVSGIPDEVTPEQAKQKILADPQYRASLGDDAPKSDSVTPYTSVTNSLSESSKVNMGIASEHAFISAGSGLIVAGIAFWLVARRLWGKPRTTPHQMGLWWGAWLIAGSLSIGISKFLSAALRLSPSGNDWYLLLLNLLVIVPLCFLIGYVIGWIFRRVFNSKKSQQNPLRDEENEEEIHRQAFVELNSPQRQAGIWAMALASTVNGGNAEGAYIAYRVAQLRKKSVSLVGEANAET